MEEEGKKVMGGIDTMFYNSQSLFIEAHDVLSLAWLSMIYFMRETTELHSFFDLGEFDDMDMDGMIEWYFSRKHQILFQDIPLLTGGYLNEELAKNLLEQCMNAAPEFYQIKHVTAFAQALEYLLETKSLVKKIYIWSETHETGLEEWIRETYGKYGSKVQYLYGPFNQAVSTVPNDSTYVFSNIEHINDLKALGKLSMSAILICNGFRYNYLLTDVNQAKLDLEKMKEEHIFKGAFFDNFTELKDKTDRELLREEDVIDVFQQMFGTPPASDKKSQTE